MTSGSTVPRGRRRLFTQEGCWDVGVLGVEGWVFGVALWEALLHDVLIK